MTQPIDRAFVDVEANTQDFSRDLNRDVEKAYDKVDRQTQLLSKKITTSFDSAGREIKRTFTTVAKEGVVTTRVVEEAFDEAGDKIQRVFKAVTKSAVKSSELVDAVAHIAADSTADGWERAGERIEDAFREAQRVAARESAKMAVEAKVAADSVERNFAGTFSKALSAIGETIVSLGSALVGLGAAAPTPAGLVAILGTVTAIAALVGPVIALGAALGTLVGLIGPVPATFGVLLAVITPLVFAFQGLGDAIKAVNEGDPDKITAAMKKLSPAAQSVVKEITGLNKVFDKFRKNIQQSFFAPLVGDIGSTARVLLPGLQKSIDKVATSLGRAASNALGFLREPAQVKILNQLFTTTASVVDSIAVGLQNVFEALFPLIQAGLPFVKQFATGFGNLLTSFAKFLTESTKTGAFNDFVNTAITTFKELVDLGKALGNLIGSIFGGFADDGQDFIQTLTKGTNALADFFRSAEGQRTLHDFVDNIKVTISVIVALAKVIQFGIKWFHFIQDSWIALGHVIADGAQAIGRFFVDLGQKIGDFAMGVVDWFKALPERIMSFLRAIPGMILDLFNFLFDELNRRIGIGIGLLIFTFTELPKRVIAAVQALPELLGDLFSAAWNFAEQKTIEGVTKVIDFVKSLPSRIMSLVSTVSGAISSFFARVFSGGKSQAKSALDAIVNFFKNLPSRLSSFVSDVGGRIGDAIKRTLNRAINKINEGLADVDRFIPGDLPRIPNLAQGAIVKAKPGGTIARIGEAGQDEIVGPLKDVAKLFEGAGGTTITFDPGSVQVTFEGAVPTESEARRTGNAVGLGIIDVLTKRNIRTTVRAA